MEILLFKTNKRINSTQVPTNGVAKSGTLKEFMSVTEPVILLEIDNFDFNYVYIFKFKRYYFVENMVLESGNLYRLYLKVDVLASFKSEIGNQEFFVERWSRTTVKNLIDPLCVADANPDIEVGTGRLPLDKKGSFVLGIVGKNSGSGVTYYSMSLGQLEKMMFFLFTAENFQDVLTNESIKAFLNPFDYIVSLMWFPFANKTTNLQNIGFGWYTSDVQGCRLTENSLESGELWVKIPRKYEKGDFRNVKYAEYSLYIPFVGEIPISSAEIANYDWISYKYSVDIATGKTQCHIGVTNNIESGTGLVIKRVEGQMGCPLAIAQTSTNVLGGSIGVISGIAGMVQNIATGVAGVIDGISNLMPKPEIKSGNGCRSVIDFESDVKLTATLYNANVISNLENGYVHGKNEMLRNLGSGFVKGNATSLKVNCFKNEKQMINDLIKGGIYLE